MSSRKQFYNAFEVHDELLAGIACRCDFGMIPLVQARQSAGQSEIGSLHEVSGRPFTSVQRHL